MMEIRPAVVAVLACSIWLLYRVLRVGHRPKGYPPGPPTMPVLGNIHQMPSRDAHKQFQAWAREYGPIYSLILGTKTLIVLSSDEASKELLDKRSAIYSDRQDMYIGQTLCSDGLRPLMMRYGPYWRRMRKMMHSLLNVNIAKSYVPYQILENKQMLASMLDDPDNFLSHIRRYSNSLTTTMTFGWRTPTADNEDMLALFDQFNKFSLINQTGTAALIDFYPFLRRMPDFVVPAQKEARELHKVEKALFLKHWLRAKNSISDGTSRPCFCIDLAKAQKEEDISDAQAAYISGTFLEAGSDTTSSTLYGFVQAMLLFPDVQKKAQKELDRVVGPDRMPVMEDEMKLQYVRGCVKESLRWMPTALLGAVPHAVTRDDSYMGYHIPAGAGILHNVYTINNDEKRYPNPRDFDPMRFKDDLQTEYEAAINPNAAERDHFSFGAGRRICPGIHVAERSLFLGMSRFLWAFSVLPAEDPVTGKPEPLPNSDDLTQGFVCMPVPYRAKIVPRDEGRAKIVRQEWEDAKKDWLDSELQWRETPEGVGLPVL